MGKIKVFEAFAGIGAQHAALKKIGINFEVVGISEIDKFAIESYKAIHGQVKNYGDISKIEANELPDFDLFTYSFPCQDLSVAGKQAGLTSGTRSGLLYECEKVIEAKKPKYLLLENVKNLVGKKFKEDFDKWLEYLEGLGYKNYWQVLNAKNYGVPQNRERVFVVSVLNDTKGFEFPAPQQLTKRVRDILEPAVDEKFYLNKPFKMINNEKVVNELESEELNSTEKILKYNDKIRLDIVGTNQPETSHSIGWRYMIFGQEGVMSALVGTDYKQPKQVLDNYRVRKLTPMECWRLMGFDDEDFKKAEAVCSNSQLYKQAGNSIVVNVLEAIFRNLFTEER